jgi:glutamine amidotransferase
MCELLGMSANVPTDICFSFAGLIQRGGQTGPHGDGWGIAFYDGKACRTFHDPEPSTRSEIARFIRGYPIKSRVVISHIRRANRGRVALENTHPFTRELWGRSWTFAHNGQLRGIKKWLLDHYQPIGTTDSEHAFCWMLDRLRSRWSTPPTAKALAREVEALCRTIDQLGVFNLLLSDSQALFCFCSTRLAVLTRRAPFGHARLIDEDLEVDFARETTPTDIVTVVATRPLTHNETWCELGKGTLLVLRDGIAAR